MLLPPQLAHFVQWFADFQVGLGDTIRTIVAPSDPPDGVVPLRAEFDPPPSPEPGAPSDPQSHDVSARIELQWAQWLDDIARPELVGLSEHVRHAASKLEQDGPLDHAMRSLRDAVDELPETVELSDAPAGADTTRPADGTPVHVPLRSHLQLAFVGEVQSAFTELRTGVERALEDVSRRVDGIEKVLEYYSLSVQRHAVEIDDPDQVEALARTGHERVRALLEELRGLRLSAARRVLGEWVERTGAALEDVCAPYRSHRPNEVRRRLEELEREGRSRPPRVSVVHRAKAAFGGLYRTARPLGRRLASEVRALLAERESDAMRRAYEQLLFRDGKALGEDLPPGYRQLFGVGAIELSDTYVNRRAPEIALERAIEAWRRGSPQSVLVYGDRGSGKRTLLNHVLAREVGRARTGWVRLGPRLSDEAVVARSLARRLNVRIDAPRFAALARARAQTESRRVMVIENAERILAPSPNGVERMTEFLRLVGDTASSTLWILLMATPAADLALHRLELAHRIPCIVRVDPMQPAEVRSLVMRRHRLSGFQLEFAPPRLRIIDHVRDPVGALRATRKPNDAFFGRLSVLAGGNPRQALYYWLSCAGPHPRREGRLFIDALPDVSDLLPSIALSQRLILALLAQHGSLTDAELSGLLGATCEGTDGDLQVLCARGLVAPSREHEQHFTLHSTSAHPLVMELRAANMI